MCVVCLCVWCVYVCVVHMCVICVCVWGGGGCMVYVWYVWDGLEWCKYIHMHNTHTPHIHINTPACINEHRPPSLLPHNGDPFTMETASPPSRSSLCSRWQPKVRGMRVYVASCIQIQLTHGCVLFKNTWRAP